MDLHELERDLEAGRSLVSAAKRIVVLTGAGISAESGVPTFRGPEGVWRHYRPEELSTPAAFARDPRLVWEWKPGEENGSSGANPTPPTWHSLPGRYDAPACAS